jgi:Omp85 superfamily domain
MTRPSLSGCVCLLLWFSAPSLAQTGRADLIGEEQAKKAQALRPETPNRAEEFINRYLSNVFAPEPVGVYPSLDSVFPGGGFALGVGYQRYIPGNVRAGGTVGWSIENYKMVEGRVSKGVLDRERLALGITARWTDAPTVAFYGFGPETRPEDRTTYDYEPTRVALTATSRPLRWIRLEGGYDYLSAPTSGDGPTLPGYSLAETPGFGEDLSYGIIRASAAIDWREPSPEYNEAGGLYRIAWQRHHELDGRPYAFDLTEVTLTQLVPLVGRHFVFAFRALGTFTDTDDGHAVPFVLAPYVGSGSTVRGFRNRRFQDRHRLVLNGEYRWQASRYLVMALFYDAGQVAPEVEAFTWRQFRTAMGIGARFHGPTFSVLRLELARSREGWKIVAGLSQPF